MIRVNALGEACPIPVVKALHAIQELKSADYVEVLVDNEIAVQNLTKLANSRNYGVKSEKLEEKKFQVTLTVGEPSESISYRREEAACIPDSRKKDMVVAISSEYMGTGDDTLGAVLMKGFLYALTQQEELPAAILFYNGGAKLTCEETPVLEDLRSMEAQGVEILTCGTCLNHYGLTDKLKVGSITNMYAIAEKMTGAGLIVKP